MSGQRRVAILGALLLFPAFLVGCTPDGDSQNPNGSAAEADTETEFSRLDDEGIERIKSSGHARLDLRSVPMNAGEHDLDDLEKLGPHVSAEKGKELHIELVAPGGQFQLIASTMSVFASEEPEGILSVDFIRPFDSLAEACKDMTEHAQQFGWSEEEIDGWCSNTSANPGANSTVAAGIGDIGLPVSVTARTGDNSAVLQYTIHTDPDLLTPSEREKIRSYPGTHVDEPEIPELATPEGESEWENHPRSASSGER